MTNTNNTTTNTPQPLKVGRIGIGEMGHGMAKNFHSHLASNGSHLTVWNRTPRKTDALKEQGAQVTTSIENLRFDLQRHLHLPLYRRRRRERLRTTRHSWPARSRNRSSLSKPQPSTQVSPQRTRNSYRRTHNTPTSNAPVFGRPDRALVGQLGFVTSGPTAALSRVHPPLITSMSKSTIDLHTPDVTKASSFKPLGNYFVAGSIELLAEGLALGEKNSLSFNLPS